MSERSPVRRDLVPLLAAGLVLLAACSQPRRADFVVPAPPTPVRARAPGCLKEAAPRTGPLTVRQAVDLALERNPDVRTAETSIRGAVAILQGARAERMPIASVDASLLGGDAPSMYLMKRLDARTFSFGDDLNDPGAFYNVELGASLRYNVWDGGRTRLGIYAAEAGVHAARSQRRVVMNDLAAGVIGSFLGARASEELLVADEASVRTVEAQVADTRAKFEQGRTLKSDLLSLQVRLATARERRIRTDVTRRLALAALRRLMALPPDAALELAPAQLDQGGLPGNRDEALVEAFRHREEVKAIRHRVRQAKIEVERAKRAGYPSLDLEARWYGDDEGLDISSNWWVLVALSWDLWDGGRRESRLQYARAVLDRVAEEDRKALLDIALDVERSLLRLEEARARFEVTGQAVGAADETLTLVGTQYQAGSATITRYLEAEEARTQARTRRIGAGLDLNRAVVQLERALGRLEREAKS